MLFCTLQSLRASAHAPYAAVAGRVEREERAADSAVAAVVYSIVTSDAFDSAALAPLLSRASYPRAIRSLQALVPRRFSDALPRVLYGANASAFAAIQIVRHFELMLDADVVAVEDLQRIATGDYRAARLALAALGFIPWRDADEGCRAIIVLRALVRAWRAQ